MFLRKTLLHIDIILAGMYIVLFILDIYNPVMAYIDNPVSKALLLLLAVISLGLSADTIRRIRRRERSVSNRPW